MRRFGAILMIFGVNIAVAAVAAVAAAVWVSALECAAAQSEGSCRAEMRLFVERMTSGGGLAYWLVVAAGLLVFWRGKQIRGR